MRLCKDCKHCVLNGEWEHAKCNAPENMQIYTCPVSGETSSRRVYEFCTTMRLPGHCGPEAKWFAAKETEAV